MADPLVNGKRCCSDSRSVDRQRHLQGVSDFDTKASRMYYQECGYSLRTSAGPCKSEEDRVEGQTCGKLRLQFDAYLLHTQRLSNRRPQLD